MPNKHQALWDNCLHLIKQNVTEQTFKTWFEPIVFESYDEAKKTVLVQVPSPYIYEYLEQNFVALMAWALSKSFKTNVRLTYRLMTDQENAYGVGYGYASGPESPSRPQEDFRQFH